MNDYQGETTMTHFLKGIKTVSLALTALALTACTALSPKTPQPTAQPTTDIKRLSTEIAATVIAQLTAEAALNPSPVPPTETPFVPTFTPVEPTPTPEMPLPTLTLPPLPTATRVPSGGGGTVIKPTRTPYTDAAELVSQTPPDGFYVPKGQDFDILWTVKNVGRRAWNTQFYLRYLSGVEGSDASKIMVHKTVPVNETYTFRVDMVAPVIAGRYVTTWQLINDDGVAILTVNLVFNSQ
jgi:hypothetical protein